MIIFGMDEALGTRFCLNPFSEMTNAKITLAEKIKRWNISSLSNPDYVIYILNSEYVIKMDPARFQWLIKSQIIVIVQCISNGNLSKGKSI